MNEIFYNILYQLMENYAMKKISRDSEGPSEWIFNDKTSQPAPLEDAKIIQIIELALRKNKGSMSFSKIKSFTGDIVKYDQERKQLIVKNFKKEYVDHYSHLWYSKISLVPHTIRIAQQNTVGF